MISVISRASPNPVKCNPPRHVRAIIPCSLTGTKLFCTPIPPSPAYPHHYMSSRSTSPTHPSMASSPYSSSSSAAPTPTTSIRSISPPSSVSSASSILASRKRVSLSGRHLINPLSFVDTAAIEAQMKLASLDHLAGYSTKAYPGPVAQTQTTEYTPEYMAKGYEVLREPSWNKSNS